MPQSALDDMARKLRVEYPGAVYHLINRGDRREPIFLEDRDRESFLETLAETCQKTGWQIHAYCLMSNHFHLVAETPRPNLVTGMKWFLGTYTARFNRRHKLSGHLFSGRYKSLLVDGRRGGYLKTVCDYVHLNPVRAGLLSEEAPLIAYPWSSYRPYIETAAKRPPWLWVDRLLGEHGIAKDSSAGRREFHLRMEARRREGNLEAWKTIRRGWALGDEQFKKELLAMMHERSGPSHYGEELRQSDEEKARTIIAEELRHLKLPDLGILAKGDPGKVRIATRLRKETAMPLRWVTQELKMGSIAYAARCLHHHHHGGTDEV